MRLRSRNTIKNGVVSRKGETEAKKHERLLRETYVNMIDTIQFSAKQKEKMIESIVKSIC